MNEILQFTWQLAHLMVHFVILMILLGVIALVATGVRILVREFF